MKKLIASLLAALLILSAAPPAPAGAGVYTEREVPLISADRESGVITLRFYAERPNVPYIGFRAFMAFVGSNPMTFEKDAEGRAVFTSAQGASAVVDAEKGTMSVENWPMFHNPPLPYEGKAVGLKDSACGFMRVRDIVYEGDPAPVLLDFAKYGLKIHAGEDDVYFPVAIVSSMMNEVAAWNMAWNGEKIYYGRYGTGTPADYMESSAIQDLIAGGARPGDIAAEVRGELFFTFDRFFGHPGRAYLDGAMAEKGLEQALRDEGAGSIAQGLGSVDFPEYFSSLISLFFWGLADGHTSPIIAAEVLNALYTGQYPEMAGEVMPGLLPLLRASTNTTRALVSQNLPEVRRSRWGDESYREYGSTAIIRLDSFMPDEAGWAAYYAGGGEMPGDGVGNTVRGLQRAADNPEIKNVIFDLSCNPGGSSDVLAFLANITTGEDRFFGIEKLTGQTMTAYYETDNNLDGVFDEKDRDTVYDQFNYGVLTTRMSFSCGNLFPFVMRERGAAVIGEASGGGACCIQFCSLSDGMNFTMSSSQWQMTDSRGAMVEGGCPVDLPLTVNELFFRGSTYEIGDFSSFFDEAELDRMMNEWFADKAADAA